MSAILRVRDENGNVHDIPAIVGPPGPQGPPGPAGSGTGDMVAAMYDPQGKRTDIFAYIDEHAVGGGSEVVKVTMPKGRMKGDVDGDGEITKADAALIKKYVNLEAELDDVQLWCADVSGDGAVSGTDTSQIGRYLSKAASSLTNTPSLADYYGNWTYVKVDNLSGYFYTDIAVDGITAASSAIIAVQGDHKRDAFAGAECMDGVVRVKANLLPLEDATCLVFHSSGDGTAIVTPENVVDRVGAPTKLLLANAAASSTKVYTITINDTGVVTATDNDGVKYTFTGTAVT